VVRYSLASPKRVFVAAGLLLAVTAYPVARLGSEFMPPLYEGALFLHARHRSGDFHLRGLEASAGCRTGILKEIPEVSQVFGKAGRAETATDPRHWRCSRRSST